MGLFRKKATTPPAPLEVPAAPTIEPITGERGDPAIEALRAELAALKERLDASDRANAELEATVGTLNQRLIVTAPPPAPPAPASPPPTEQVELAPSSVAVHQAQTEAAIEQLQASLGELDQRIALVDSRVTSVSTELANQLTEIGNDIEPMHDSAERLAAEQARYQIQFRQDLAELAERIRRPGTT